MKNIKNIAEFARQHNQSPQAIGQRIKRGWQFGILNGKRVMYSPKHVQEINEEWKND